MSGLSSPTLNLPCVHVSGWSLRVWGGLKTLCVCLDRAINYSYPPVWFKQPLNLSLHFHLPLILSSRRNTERQKKHMKVCCRLKIFLQRWRRPLCNNLVSVLWSYFVFFLLEVWGIVHSTSVLLRMGVHYALCSWSQKPFQDKNVGLFVCCGRILFYFVSFPHAVTEIHAH